MIALPTASQNKIRAPPKDLQKLHAAAKNQPCLKEIFVLLASWAFQTSDSAC